MYQMVCRCCICFLCFQCQEPFSLSALRQGYSEALASLSLGPVVQTPLADSTVSPLINPATEFRQSAVSVVKNKQLWENILPDLALERKLLISSRTCKGANNWLTTAPSALNKTAIDPCAFRMLLKFNLGLPLFEGMHDCPDCSKSQDNYGYHALSCKIAAAPIHRHDSLVNCIADALRKAKIPCDTNVGSTTQQNNERPGDIFINDFDRFGDAYFDLSVVNIFAKAYFQRASKGVLQGSRIRFNQKKAKYADLGPRMKPLVVECTGGWDSFSLDYLKSIAESIAARSRKTAKLTLNSLLASLSCRLQRHQGTLLVRRCLGL